MPGELPPAAARLSPAALEAAVAVASAWPLVTASREGGTTTLSVAGHAFATASPGGVELVLPPRVRDMLVTTGRARELAEPRRALALPEPDGAVDPALLRLAYERARIAADSVRGQGGSAA
jgi:hypothetical protein